MAQNDVVRNVEWAVLMAQLPARERSSAGVLLLDLISDELHVRLQPELAGANEDAAEFWRELSDDLIKRSRVVGGRQVLDWLETTASHLIQLGSRHSMEATSPRKHWICCTNGMSLRMSRLNSRFNRSFVAVRHPELAVMSYFRIGSPKSCCHFGSIERRASHSAFIVSLACFIL